MEGVFLVFSGLAQSVEKSPCNRKVLGVIPAIVNSMYE